MTQYRISIDKFTTSRGDRYIARAETFDGYTVESDVWADECQAVAEAEYLLKQQVNQPVVEYVDQPADEAECTCNGWGCRVCEVDQNYDMAMYAEPEAAQPPTTNLDSLNEYIRENDGLGDLHAAETIPNDEAEALYDLAMSAKESADMYRKDGFPFIADEYMARARAYGRRWRKMMAEQRDDRAAGLKVAA